MEMYDGTAWTAPLVPTPCYTARDVGGVHLHPPGRQRLPSHQLLFFISYAYVSFTFCGMLYFVGTNWRQVPQLQIEFS